METGPLGTVEVGAKDWTPGFYRVEAEDGTRVLGKGRLCVLWSWRLKTLLLSPMEEKLTTGS